MKTSRKVIYYDTRIAETRAKVYSLHVRNHEPEVFATLMSYPVM